MTTGCLNISFVILSTLLIWSACRRFCSQLYSHTGFFLLSYLRSFLQYDFDVMDNDSPLPFDHVRNLLYILLFSGDTSALFTKLPKVCEIFLVLLPLLWTWVSTTNADQWVTSFFFSLLLDLPPWVFGCTIPRLLLWIQVYSVVFQCKRQIFRSSKKACPIFDRFWGYVSSFLVKVVIVFPNRSLLRMVLYWSSPSIHMVVFRFNSHVASRYLHRILSCILIRRPLDQSDSGFSLCLYLMIWHFPQGW